MRAEDGSGGGAVYLNNAHTSWPKPPGVAEAVAECVAAIPSEPGRGGGLEGRPDVAALCRRGLCQLFPGSSPEEFSFTSGATESLNLAIRGLGLDGGHVVSTEAEHNSVLRPLKRLEAEGRISLSIAPCDGSGRVDPADVAGLMRPDTRAVVVNHCSNVTGVRQDIAEIGRAAASRGAVLLVDASQSAGLFPLDVAACGVGVLAFSGHKHLYGPRGAGVAWIRGGLRVEPLKTGGTGVRSESLLQPESRPMLYEAGTQNIPGIAGLLAGVSFVSDQDAGKRAVARERAFLRLVGRLLEDDGVEVHGGSSLDDFKGRAPLLSFNVRGVGPEEAEYVLLHSFGIHLRQGLHCAPLIHKRLGTLPQGSLRASFSDFNTCDDSDRLADALGKIRRLARGRT